MSGKVLFGVVSLIPVFMADNAAWIELKAMKTSDDNND
jgi:hypothetical protein